MKPGNINHDSRRKTIARIEAWFDSHEDGDFQRRVSEIPFEFIPANREVQQIVLTTKRSVARRLVAFGSAFEQFAFLAGYGLPSSKDMAFLLDCAHGKRTYYLGDLDPVDLLIFAWHREQFAPIEVEYLGISDDLLMRHQIEVPANFQISLSSSEKEALPLVRDCISDLEGLVGRRSFEILFGGRKIELEAFALSLGV